VVVGQALSKAQRGDPSDSPERVRRLHTAANVLGNVQLGVVAGILALTSMLAMESGRSLRWSARSRRLP
jgi:hypothetical protein